MLLVWLVDFNPLLITMPNTATNSGVLMVGGFLFRPSLVRNARSDNFFMYPRRTKRTITIATTAETKSVKNGLEETAKHPSMNRYLLPNRYDERYDNEEDDDNGNNINPSEEKRFRYSLELLAIAVSLFFVVTVYIVGDRLFVIAPPITSEATAPQRKLIDADALLQDEFNNIPSSVPFK